MIFFLNDKFHLFISKKKNIKKIKNKKYLLTAFNLIKCFINLDIKIIIVF